MKKLYILTLFVAFAAFANAQNYDVALRVDMSAVTTVDDTVCVAGDFQDSDAVLTGVSDWTAGAHILTDDDGNGVYYILLSLPAGTYQYKFINGGTWGDNEGAGLDATCGIDDGFGNFNRGMTISSDTSISYIYDSCTELDATSTENLKQVTSFKITPNPLTSYSVINIDNSKSTTHDVIVTDIAGRTVKTMNAVRGSQIGIERGNLNPGIYFVTVINEDGERGTQKLMIQ